MLRLKRFRLVAIIVCFMLALTAALWQRAPPRPSYQITDLGTLPGDTVSSASGINNQGEVVGTSYSPKGQATTFHSFLYRHGTMIALASSLSLREPAINESGQVTGQMAIRQNVSHAFLFSAGKLQDLGTLPGFTESSGTALNKQGEVIGIAIRDNAPRSRQTRHPFLYRAGQMKDLGSPAGNGRNFAAGINNAGQIAGYTLGRPRCQAYILDSRTGRKTILPLASGFRFASAHSINDRGQVIGDADNSDTVHAALWSGGAMTDLGRLPGAKYMNCSGLNNQGEVVGGATSEPGMLGKFLSASLRSTNPLRVLVKTDWDERAFLYKAGRMIDLNDLIPVDADWTLEEANGINDRGQIVGLGLHHGQERAFLLTPTR